MLAPWLLATLCFLSLPVYASSHPHGSGPVHERHGMFVAYPAGRHRQRRA